MPPEEWDDEEYLRQGKINLSEPRKSFPGKSNFADHSDWRDLHLAIQRAAAAASNDGEEGWFDLTNLKVLVGNQNVKIFSAVLVKGDPPD
jgi:hypothetical protein